MALHARWGGTARSVASLGVRWGGTNRLIKRLFVARNVWVQPPTDFDPDTGQPTPPYWRTVYDLVAEFAPPDQTPPTPSLGEYRPDGTGEYREPYTIARWLYRDRHDPNNPNFWNYRVQYEADGVLSADYVANSQGYSAGYVEHVRGWVWGTLVRCRIAYVNEAGAGPYSGWSNYVNVVSDIDDHGVDN